MSEQPPARVIPGPWTGSGPEPDDPQPRWHATPPTPALWQVVLTIGDQPATDENQARAVLVAIGFRAEKLDLVEEEPEYGIWLVGLPFLPLPPDSGREIHAQEARVIMANGEFQMEVPLP